MKNLKIFPNKISVDNNINKLLSYLKPRATALIAFVGVVTFELSLPFVDSYSILLSTVVLLILLTRILLGSNHFDLTLGTFIFCHFLMMTLSQFGVEFSLQQYILDLMRVIIIVRESMNKPFQNLKNLSHENQV